MDETLMQLKQSLIEVETEAEHLLLARHEMIENDKVRNGNREALAALRKIARARKTSTASPFESLMKDFRRSRLVKEVCATCDNYDSEARTWMVLPGTDLFLRVPFHAAHSILETGQARLDAEAEKLQSYMKEKALSISEKGAIADKISPGILTSMVSLTDKPSGRGSPD